MSQRDALPDREIAAAERYLTLLSEYAADDNDTMSDDQRAELRTTLKRGIASARAGESRPVDE